MDEAFSDYQVIPEETIIPEETTLKEKLIAVNLLEYPQFYSISVLSACRAATVLATALQVAKQTLQSPIKPLLKTCCLTDAIA